MKTKNLKLRKTAFLIGLSFTLIGCSKENDKMIPALIVEESMIEMPKKELIPEEELMPEIVEEQPKVDYESIEYKENSYTTTTLNFRDEPSLEGNVITVIDKCQKLMKIEDNGDWSVIKYNDQVGYVNNKYIETLPTNYIEVDISDQNIKYHIENELLLDSDVVTGKLNINDTRIGMFEIYSRETSRYLTGPGYRSYVNYWMPFDGGIGLHDALWRDEFGGDIYINSGSHGCVNLPLEIAETIYENSEVGTKVLVHK